MHPGQDGLQSTYGKGRCYNYCKFATVFVVEPSHDGEVIAICNLNTGMNQLDTELFNKHLRGPRAFIHTL